MAGDAPYDPDQDPEERRVVRKGYRTLAKNVEGSSIILSVFLTLISTRY